MKINYIITDTGITAVIDGVQYTVANDNPVYGQVKDAIRKGERSDIVADLFRTAAAIGRYTGGEVVVVDGSLYYKGEEVHNHVVDRILEFMSDRLPVEPLIKFLKNLLENPSKRAIDELYTFLEHKNMPLTDDGCFLAYKGVNHDYSDIYSGQYDNSPGKTLRMKRSKVCDNADLGCSEGFHAGSLEYASSYGSSGRLVLVKINPKNVVSVPKDCSCQKLRTAEYTVVGDFNGAISRPLVNAATPYDYEEVSSFSEDEDEDDFGSGLF